MNWDRAHKIATGVLGALYGVAAALLGTHALGATRDRDLTLLLVVLGGLGITAARPLLNIGGQK